jgi:hypothetical protein
LLLGLAALTRVPDRDPDPDAGRDPARRPARQTHASRIRPAVLLTE